MSMLGKQRAAEWERLWESFRSIERTMARDPGSIAVNAVFAAVRAYLERLFRIADAGGPVVWYNLGFNPDILFGLEGVANVCIESMAVLHNFAGDVRVTCDLIDAAEASGVPADCCSADKSAVGAMMRGLYPAPRCAVGINTPCDSQVLSTQAMQRACGRPMFVVDVPYYEDERSVRHVARQLRDLVAFLEKHVGQRYDWDLARRACEHSNEAVNLIYDWLDLRKHRPTMQPSKLAGLTLVIQVILTGLPEGARLARALHDDALARIRAGRVDFEERARAIWYQDPVWWDFQIYDWMEAKLGLAVAADLFGYYAADGIIDTSSEESILEGIARKLILCMPMSRQFRGSMQRYCDDFLALHDAFGADCGIFAGHIACKHAWGGIGLFKEACRRAGVPLLVFDFDMFDPRVTSYRRVQTSIERFVNEVVIPRKARSSE